MNKLKIEYVDIDTIIPYKNNAKEHPAEQIDQIKKSIEEFGFNDPIAVWNNQIVEGHGRYYAAKQLGIHAIPVIRLDSLTDEQRKAYCLVHNQLTMNSGFDADALSKELESLSDIDMSLYGFDALEEEAENLDKERKEVAMNDEITVVVEAKDSEDAESLFNEMTNRGYTCHISTL